MQLTKKILPIIAVLLSAAFAYGAARIVSAAELTPCALEFTPSDGGRYIYCNNAEAVFADTLANGDTPTYLMNNVNLAPDVYYLYISHFNYLNYDWGLGGDTELDVEITAREDAVIRVDKTGFDTPYPFVYYSGGALVKDENEWENLQACADMWGDIYNINGDYTYADNSAGNAALGTERIIKAGETVWLSEYIDNYRAAANIKPVHMQALLEVLSGKVDINVVMLKSSGTVGDRSDFDRDSVAFGVYQRDRTQKGVADTFPVVTAELQYTIDDGNAAGEELPVVVTNQYVPDGNTVTTWASHLNPQDDIWSKSITAESDMLTLEYIDDSKLDYYGDNVPESERDNVWIFDPFHSDTREWESGTGIAKADYSPNYELSPDEDNQGYACSMGNYGVWTVYHLTVTNDGTRDRYIEYAPKTRSNMLVYTTHDSSELALTSAHGKTYCKGMSEESREDIMSSELIPAGETVDFYVCVNLPVNTFGGVMNTFRIADRNNFTPTEVGARVTYPANDYPLLSEFADLPEETAAAFEGNLDNYEVICGDGEYIARSAAWDGKPYYCSSIWEHTSIVYRLDADMNIVGSYTFPSTTMQGAYTDGKFYIKTLYGGWLISSNGGASWTAANAPEVTAADYTRAALAACDTATLYNAGKSVTTVDADDVAEILADAELAETGDTLADGLCVHMGDKIIIDANGVIEYNNGGRIMYCKAEGDVWEKYMLYLYYSKIGKLDCSDWAEEDMLSAFEDGIVPTELMTAGRDWTEAITRGDFCALAAEMLDSLGLIDDNTQISKSVFSDTASSVITTLNKLGIIYGYEDGTFRPNANITRAEAAAILMRTARLTEMWDGAAMSEELYADDADLDWAAEYVYAARETGIMLGVGDNTFSPDTAYTAEQAVVTMLRIYAVSA